MLLQINPSATIEARGGGSASPFQRVDIFLFLIAGFRMNWTGRQTVWQASVVVMLALLPVLTLGCGKPPGPELGDVTGIVTLDGEPVEGASLTFIPLPGSSIVRPAYGRTDAEGRYVAVFSTSREGVPTGKCNVQIGTDDTARWKGQEYNLTELFPKKYRSKEQIIEIVPGKNQHDFHCETEGAKARTIDPNR